MTFKKCSINGIVYGDQSEIHYGKSDDVIKVNDLSLILIKTLHIKYRLLLLSELSVFVYYLCSSIRRTWTNRHLPLSSGVTIIRTTTKLTKASEE
jgi:hypothetical protein